MQQRVTSSVLCMRLLLGFAPFFLWAAMWGALAEGVTRRFDIARRITLR
jgi:hypothetical protein